MAKMNWEGCRIHDVVRDSKIHWDGFSEIDQNHYRQQAVGVFPHTRFGEIGEGYERRQSSSSELEYIWRTGYGLTEKILFDQQSVQALERKVKLPTFDSSSLKLDFLDWFDTFEDYFEAVNLPDTVKCKLVASRLRGEARIWWEELQNRTISQGEDLINSWPLMRDFLLKRFLHTSCLTYFHNQPKKQEHEDNVKPANCSTICPLQSVKAKQEEIVVGSSSRDDALSTVTADSCMPIMCLTKFPNQQNKRKEAVKWTEVQLTSFVATSNLMKAITVNEQKAGAGLGADTKHNFNTSENGKELGRTTKLDDANDERSRRQIHLMPSNIDFRVGLRLMLLFDPGGIFHPSRARVSSLLTENLANSVSFDHAQAKQNSCDRNLGVAIQDKCVNRGMVCLNKPLNSELYFPVVVDLGIACRVISLHFPKMIDDMQAFSYFDENGTVMLDCVAAEKQFAPIELSTLVSSWDFDDVHMFLFDPGGRFDSSVHWGFKNYSLVMVCCTREVPMTFSFDPGGSSCSTESWGIIHLIIYAESFVLMTHTDTEETQVDGAKSKPEGPGLELRLCRPAKAFFTYPLVLAHDSCQGSLSPTSFNMEQNHQPLLLAATESTWSSVGLKDKTSKLVMFQTLFSADFVVDVFLFDPGGNISLSDKLGFEHYPLFCISKLVGLQNEHAMFRLFGEDSEMEEEHMVDNRDLLELCGPFQSLGYLLRVNLALKGKPKVYPSMIEQNRDNIGLQLGSYDTLSKIYIFFVVLSMPGNFSINEIGKVVTYRVGQKFGEDNKGTHIMNFVAREPVVILGFDQMDQAINKVMPNVLHYVFVKNSLLYLPDLPVECMCWRLCPSGLCTMAIMCWCLQENCTSDYLWKEYVKQKRSILITDSPNLFMYRQHGVLTKNLDSISYKHLLAAQARCFMAHEKFFLNDKWKEKLKGPGSNGMVYGNLIQRDVVKGTEKKAVRCYEKAIDKDAMIKMYTAVATSLLSTLNTLTRRYDKALDLLDSILLLHKSLGIPNMLKLIAGIVKPQSWETSKKISVKMRSSSIDLFLRVTVSSMWEYLSVSEVVSTPSQEAAVVVSPGLGILCDNGHRKKTLKLFFKLVNGLDPPNDEMTTEGREKLNVEFYEFARGRALFWGAMEMM